MLDSLAQRARGRRATSEHQQPGDYRFEAMSRMLFFSRLRASASTWSFHRSVFHSAPRGVVVEPDWAGLRPAWPEFTDGESAFRPLLGVALDLDLGMDMAHLRGVGDLSGDRHRDVRSRRIACLFANVMLQACRMAVDAHMEITTHSWRDRCRSPR